MVRVWKEAAEFLFEDNISVLFDCIMEADAGQLKQKREPELQLLKWNR
jgi:hypothetical protein